uniref:Uncharacterized protein n=1 Tax=Arundo donax TaxID=35708 RepID=A0A0A9FN64_ARUDO
MRLPWSPVFLPSMAPVALGGYQPRPLSSSFTCITRTAVWLSAGPSTSSGPICILLSTRGKPSGAMALYRTVSLVLTLRQRNGLLSQARVRKTMVVRSTMSTLTCVLNLLWVSWTAT